MKNKIINILVCLLTMASMVVLPACSAGTVHDLRPVDITDCSNIIVGLSSVDTSSPSYDPMTRLPASTPLTVNVFPDNATNKNIDWAVEWADTNSNNVTDYIKVIPNTPNTNSATLWCYKPFGTKIKVIASAAENSAVTAECVVDFQPRMQYKSFYFSSASGFPNDSTSRKRIDITCSSLNFILENNAYSRDFSYPDNMPPIEFYICETMTKGNTYDFYSNSSIPFTSGTIYKNLAVPQTTVSFNLTNSFRDILAARGISYLYFPSSMYSNIDISLGSANINFNGYLLDKIFPGVFTTTGLLEKVKSAFVEAENTTEGAFQAYVKMEYTQAPDYPVYFYRMNLRVNPESIKMRVSTLSIDTSIII